jgi:hypothetical protein
MTTSANADHTRTGYRARYGNAPCTAYPEGETNGRTFSVLLKVDPGYGSMVHTRIHRSQITFIEPPSQEGDQP